MDILKNKLFYLLYTYSSVQSLLEGLDIDEVDNELLEEVKKRVNIYRQLVVKSNLQEEYSNFTYQKDEW